MKTWRREAAAALCSAWFYLLKCESASISVIRNAFALTGVAQWIERRPVNQWVTVQFPVRAHAWVAGQVPSRGCVRGNHTMMFPSRKKKKKPFIFWRVDYTPINYSSSQTKARVTAFLFAVFVWPGQLTSEEGIAVTLDEAHHVCSVPCWFHWCCPKAALES